MKLIISCLLTVLFITNLVAAASYAVEEVKPTKVSVRSASSYYMHHVMKEKRHSKAPARSLSDYLLLTASNIATEKRCGNAPARSLSSNMPKALLAHNVVTLLDGKSLIALSIVSKRWRQFLSNDKLWRNAACTELGLTSLPAVYAHTREFVINCHGYSFTDMGNPIDSLEISALLSDDGRTVVLQSWVFKQTIIRRHDQSDILLENFEAQVISPDGSVVTGLSYKDRPIVTRWTSAKGLEYLAETGSTSQTSLTNTSNKAVKSKDQLISIEKEGGKPVRNYNGTREPVEAILKSKNVLPVGWTLDDEVYAISPNGVFMLGLGHKDGEEKVWLVTIPRSHGAKLPISRPKIRVASDASDEEHIKKKNRKV